MLVVFFRSTSQLGAEDQRSVAPAVLAQGAQGFRPWMAEAPQAIEAVCFCVVHTSDSGRERAHPDMPDRDALEPFGPIWGQSP